MGTPASETYMSKMVSDGNAPRRQGLNSPQIYALVAREGREEMARPALSLLWSGIAAGLLISFSLVFKAILRVEFTDFRAHHAIESMGYTVGFIMVIFARLQLFTENTISPVLPTVAVPSKTNMRNTVRIWVISLGANLLGTATMAFMLTRTPMVSSDVVTAIAQISLEVYEFGPLETFTRAIPAGLLIAALVWARPNTMGSEFALIFIITYLIAIGDFAHVVVGSAELLSLVSLGQASIMRVLTSNLLPAFLGNVVGGTGLFALIAWAQIRQEVQEEVASLREEAEAEEQDSGPDDAGGTGLRGVKEGSDRH